MKTSESPLVRVGIRINTPHDIILHGDYQSEISGETNIHTPLSEDCRAELPAVKIGIGFHWEREIPFILCGTLKISKFRDGWLLVNTLPVEKYLESVVSSEMNPDAPEEFIRAHAVISRGWLLGKLRHSSPDESGKLLSDMRIITWEDTSDHSGFDVCSDDHCQRYQGMASVNSRVVKAVKSTAGMVLTDSNGALADTRFSKCCGGRTELFSTCWQNQDYDYLPSKEDPYCNPDYPSKQDMSGILSSVLKDYDHTGYYSWTVNISSEELRIRIKERYGKDLGEIHSISPVKTGCSGRLYEIAIQGEMGTLHVGKELEIRRLLSGATLKSSMFEVIPQSDGFRFEGKGWGHGVGLCQIGAAVMAAEGFTAEEILQFYYPGTSLVTLY